MKVKNHSTSALFLVSAFSIFLLTGTRLYATPELEPTADIEVAEFIQMELYHDSKMSGSEVEVTIDHGIARVTGKARSLAQIERATAKLYSNPSVLSVINLMEVEPGITSISQSVLEDQNLFDAEAVFVKSEGNHLILSGEVNTLDEVVLARELASETPGVTYIENRITHQFRKPRTDSQIAHHLAFKVNDDPVFAGLQLAPEVKDGQVYWSGEVGSKQDQDRLTRMSRVAGVKEIVMDKVSINNDLKMEATEDKDFSPAQRLQALEIALRHEQQVNETLIKASTQEGIMTVRGTVSNEDQRRFVERTARCIPGVLKVENELKVTEKSDLAHSKDDRSLSFSN